MATTKTRKKTNKGGASTKKPKWSIITYRQIETRRVELGLSKSAMAKALGVTNSTYHNWKQGRTVPHPNQQEQIQATLAGLKPGAPPVTPAASKDTASKAKGRGKAPRARGKAHAPDRSFPGTDVGAARDVGGGTHSMSGYTEAHPFYSGAGGSVQGIAQITSAWITSQNKSPSAGSVYEFVDGLKEALRD